jgi:hypothetical protein
VAAAIPEDVRLLIQRYIDSIEQLEILLLLHASSREQWTPDSVSRALYSTPSSTGRRLKTLHGQGFLGLDDSSSPPTYSYQPASTELDATVARLAETYRERRVAVVSLVASKPMDNVRAFSDAFRIRKKDGD